MQRGGQKVLQRPLKQLVDDFARALVSHGRFGLGIETVGGLMDSIIPRNSKVPHRAARSYTTSVDGQANMKIAVFQGERDLVQHNRKLGEFILKGIPPMPMGIPKIEIAFILDKKESAVKMKLYRSLNKLKERYENMNKLKND